MYFELILYASENLYGFPLAVKGAASFSSFMNSVESLCPSYQRGYNTRNQPCLWVAFAIFDGCQDPVVLSVMNVRDFNSAIKFSTALTNSG